MLFRSDRKSTRLNSSHTIISYAVFCLTKKNRAASTTRSPECTARRPRPRTTLAPAGDLALVYLGSEPRRRCEWDVPSGSFFFNDTATTEIYTLSLHDALPI